MKKINKIKTIPIISSILFSIIYCLFSTPAFAAPQPTPVPSRNEVATDSADIEKIQRIKDIVASKVAELNLVEKRGIIGKIKDSTNMHATIEDLKGNTRLIDVDELTKFDSSDNKNTGISDLKKDIYYSFVGLYNRDTRRLLARTVGEVTTIPFYFEGAVSETHPADYQLTAINNKGEKKTIDIQASTKTSLSNTDADLTKSGFSKININERILVIGFLDKKDSNLISASRVIHFQNIPPSRQMQSYIQNGDNSASESGK